MKSNTLCVVVLLIFVSTCFCGEFDDDEEFVGTTKQQPTIKIQQIPELSSQTTNPIYQTQEVKPRSWILEITYVFLIGAYVINYFLGKRKNNAIAYSWAQSVVPFLKEQFSKVGEAKEGSTAVQVVPENAYSYRLQATGRVNCVGMQCSLTLRKRHDLMSLLFEYFTGSQDILSIDILFNEEVEDFVFAVLKTKDEKKMRKKFSDLSTFTRSEEHKDLSSKLCVCSEVEELSSEILSSEVCNALNSFEDQFISLRISDQSISADGYKHSLRMEIKLPSRADADLMSQNLLTLTKMAVYLIDVIPRIRLSKIAKQKTEKNRAKLAEFQQKQMHAQRQEAAQQKKLEKKQKELEQLDPQARARMEEKIAKKELKRKQKLRVVHV